MVHLKGPEPRISSGQVALVARAAAGDRAAFNAIYQKYVHKVYNLIFKMLHGAPASEELTQEVFLQVYRSLPRFQGRSELFTWIYRIASNTCLAHLKRERVQARTRAALALEPSDHVAESAETCAERRELIASAVEGLSHLSPLQRMVMILGPIQGYNHRQMGAILGLSPDAIKGQLHRARTALKRMLASPDSAVAA